MGTLSLFGAALAALEWRRDGRQETDRNLQVPATNPLQLPTALTFAVIFATLVVQGLSLPSLIRRLRIETMSSDLPFYWT